mgnify:CR=1 FL=1
MKYIFRTYIWPEFHSWFLQHHIIPAHKRQRMLNQQQADILIRALKEAVKREAFEWIATERHDELFVTVANAGVEFVLSLNRNPFEIRLHLRTKKENTGLMRLDGAPYHSNPDGTELRDTPHLHYFKEGYGLKWANPVDWYDVKDPFGTLERFLKEIQARFPGGIQTAMV